MAKKVNINVKAKAEGKEEVVDLAKNVEKLKKESENPINIKTNAGDLSGVEALENRIKQIKNEKIQLRIDAKTEELNSVNQKIEQVKRSIAGLEAVPAHIGVDIDKSEIESLKVELKNLEAKSAKLDLDIEMDKLNQAKDKVDDLDDTEIDVDINNISAMAALEQIGQGFDRLKQGAREVGQQMGELLTAAGKQESNKVFLQHAVGAERAAKATEDINAAVQKLPGDDTVMQGLLSQAVAKDATITASALNDMGVAAADYFSAMSFYGKSATEAQQDMTNYLLAGNTAELERSPILSSHIDKLKEGTTIQERAKLLQEALNEEHWGGMSQQDTYNNKLETFNGMLERGRYNLGGMFQEGAKNAMDFIMKLDEGTNGLVGMGLALASFATPLTDVFMGIGQIGQGMRALKDASDFVGLTSQFSKLVQYLKDLELAEKAATAAQWLYNAALSANPIGIIIIAIAALVAILAYLYFNNEQVRESINQLGAVFQYVGQVIYSFFIMQIQLLVTALQMAWSYISTLPDRILQTMTTIASTVISGAMALLSFISSIPGRVGAYLSQVISRAISFASNFVTQLWNAGKNALTRFIDNIKQIPVRLGQELSNALNKVNEWAATLPAKFWEAGVNAVKNFLNALGIHSPGIMQRMLVWEVTEMGKQVPIKGKEVISNITDLGSDIVKGFGNPSLSFDFDDNLNANVNANNRLLDDNKQQHGDLILNLSVGTVDKRERIDEIVSIIRDEIYWDNTTAGRSV